MNQPRTIVLNEGLTATISSHAGQSDGPVYVHIKGVSDGKIVNKRLPSSG